MQHNGDPNSISGGETLGAEVHQIVDPLRFVEQSDTEQPPDAYLDTQTWDEVKRQVGGNIIVDDLDSPHTTVVGLKKTGKSTLMHMAGQRLDIPYVDAGLLFRSIAQRAIESGFTGGEVSDRLIEMLVAELEASEIQFAQPAHDIDQSIVLGSTRYEYTHDLESVDSSITGQLSQQPAILRTAMDVLIDRTGQANQLMLIGGRSLNQEFRSALARFYIERQGASLTPAEQGSAWSLDSPQQSPRIIQLLNPEGQQILAAEVMAMVIARRAEARVADDKGYELDAANGLLISGEPAKANEINSALSHRESLLHMPNLIHLPTALIEELREGVMAKARHARQKFANQLLVVESTTLYIPELYASGLPAEFIEWLSKKDHQRLAALVSNNEVAAVAITVMAQINERSEVRLGQGAVSGKFLKHSRGNGGIGWDPNFIPDGMQATYAEMGDEKSLASSRALAANELL